MPRPRLDPRTPLTELHVHLGAAVSPAVMWGIAHAQGIRLPTKDYWAFRDLITFGRRRRSFNAYLDLFHWTELIHCTPTCRIQDGPVAMRRLAQSPNRRPCRASR